MKNSSKKIASVWLLAAVDKATNETRVFSAYTRKDARERRVTMQKLGYRVAIPQRVLLEV